MHKALNYGAVMQAYALGRVCKELGFDVKMINLEWNDFLLLRLKKSWHFKRFRAKYLPVDTNRRLRKLGDFYLNEDLEADFCIVGSDQVWNLDITGDMYPAFFLDFVKRGKKISYAASFGSDNWLWKGKQQDEIKNCLESFEAVSVREGRGVNICRQVFAVEATHVLDPTLLLNDYSAIIGQKDQTGDELISYKFIKDNSYYDLLNAIKIELGLKRVKELSSMKPRFYKNICFPVQISVENWLKSIRDASFIVTDSFHGVSFCIIFEKQFIYIPGLAERANRIMDLLALLGLESRMFKDVDRVRKERRWLTPIDYNDVKKKLAALRNDSLNFLKTSLHV